MQSTAAIERTKLSAAKSRRREAQILETRHAIHPGTLFGEGLCYALVKMRKRRVVIVCTGNSCRSQMAEGLLRRLQGDRIEVSSAGTRPAEKVHPMAIDAMHEIGIDISCARTKSLGDLSGEFDLAVTVCDSANESCPVVPGSGARRHLSFEDPASAKGSYQERRTAFRKVRDDLRKRLVPYVDKLLRSAVVPGPDRPEERASDG